MTTNQITYLRNQEEARHNRVSEEQGERQTQATTQNSASSYITAMANAKQAEAAMNQAGARYAELGYKYATLPLYEREIAAKERQAEASATTASANRYNAQTNRGQLGVSILEAIQNNARVQGYLREVENKVASTELEREKMHQQMEQFLLNYALAKDDLERQKQRDAWERTFNTWSQNSRDLRDFTSAMLRAHATLGID